MSQCTQVSYRHDYQPPKFTIDDVHLTIDIHEKKTIVTARSQVILQEDACGEITLDGEELALINISVNDLPWKSYQLAEHKLIIHDLPDRFTLNITCEIDPSANSALQGLYQSGEVMCSQCEPHGFRHITYYPDRPDVLAKFTTRISADKTCYPYLLSNGNPVASGDLADGRHWVEWQDPFPKPCYLFAVVAGDFAILRDSYTTASGRDVILELYVDHGREARGEWAVTSLKNAMAWDEQRFGLEYDLDCYMIVAVDFFNMGAMENKGLNIFNSRYVLADALTATDRDYLNIEAVIGHEYFHNWTGNRVTCRDWFQLSLKEGLTVFREQEFSADMGARATSRIGKAKMIRSLQFAEDASPMAHPIRPDKVIEMNNFYTLTVYEKGAEVIRMLHTLLGEQRFQAGIALYFSRHDGSAATCDDFVQAMEDAGGIDLTQFRCWYSQSGTPVLTVSDSYDPLSQQYTLRVQQMTPVGEGRQLKQPLHIPLLIALYDAEGFEIALRCDGQPHSSVLDVTQAENTYIFEQVASRPIPSLLREFSAPVKLNYPWDDEQLLFLVRNDSSAFSRWDAAQNLLLKHLCLNLEHVKNGGLVHIPPQILGLFREILATKELDPQLLSQILTLPDEGEIAERFALIDPAAISKVRYGWVRVLAKEFAVEWLALQQSIELPVYRAIHADIAQRSLRNLCVYYLAFSGADGMEQMLAQQYYRANNMTDSLAILSAVLMAQLTVGEELLRHFEQRWQNDGLVMDKWFALQAQIPHWQTVERVRLLLDHPSFSLKNPNRVYALIGTFASANPTAFHNKAGCGYQLLTDLLLRLNYSNPQVAARLVDPLIRFKRYDADRQKMMKEKLLQLRALPDLSSDLFEKIHTAIGGESV